ncbi:MAG: GNAT family N-acetyltransferase [Verrucomicrobiota bacterium]|jgi:GNAT superfamily N-acetyltransferase
MEKLATIVPAAEADLTELAQLAGTIWRACYPGIISHAQIEFMLAHMYAPETLREEVRSQGIRFYRLLVGERFGGFASLGPTAAAGVMKLHKLYLLPELQGRGLGRLLLEYCAAEAQQLGAARLILAVNKRNARAISAYQHNGFAIAESVVTDIGGGFVMDDYIMERAVE